MSLSKADVVGRFLTPEMLAGKAQGERGEAYAPSNIALSKYWGKRDKPLNLPVNGSISVSLAHLGTHTTITESATGTDCVTLNGQVLDLNESFAKKVLAYVALFRRNGTQPLLIETTNTIPTAAGLASSASGFAALTLALARFYKLELDASVLSAFARMGSGSASRSLYHGFVEWQKGEQADGLDSCAHRYDMEWPELRVGLVKVSVAQKPVNSGDGMTLTRDTSVLYESWPKQAEQDLVTIRNAIKAKDFEAMGSCAEHNALAMHATMVSSWPPLLYWQPETVAAMHKVWQLRADGVPVYLTIDAGPNVKLLFEESAQSDILAALGDIEVITPFAADVPPVGV